jgi:hypothetical protein
MKAIIGLLLVFVLVLWGCAKDDDPTPDASQDATTEVDSAPEPELDGGAEPEPDLGAEEDIGTSE